MAQRSTKRKANGKPKRERKRQPVDNGRADKDARTGRFLPGNQAAVGYGPPPKDWDIETEALNWSIPIMRRFGMMGATARSPQDVAAGKAALAYAHGLPRQRTEITGKGGKDLIPSRDDAIEALRTAVPTALAPKPPDPDDDDSDNGGGAGA